MPRLSLAVSEVSVGPFSRFRTRIRDREWRQRQSTVLHGLTKMWRLKIYALVRTRPPQKKPRWRYGVRRRCACNVKVGCERCEWRYAGMSLSQTLLAARPRPRIPGQRVTKESNRSSRFSNSNGRHYWGADLADQAGAQSKKEKNSFSIKPAQSQSHPALGRDRQVTHHSDI